MSCPTRWPGRLLVCCNVLDKVPYGGEAMSSTKRDPVPGVFISDTAPGAFNRSNPPPTVFEQSELPPTVFKDSDLAPSCGGPSQSNILRILTRNYLSKLKRVRRRNAACSRRARSVFSCGVIWEIGRRPATAWSLLRASCRRVGFAPSHLRTWCGVPAFERHRLDLSWPV